MAITPTQRTSFTSTTANTTFTTSSYTPTANTLLLAYISTGTTGAAPFPATVTGNGLTWVKINEIAITSTNNAGSLWRAMGPAPTAGGLTATFATSVTNIGIRVVEVSGVDTSGTNGSGAVRRSTTANANALAVSATFGTAVNAGNATFGFGTTNSGSGNATSVGTGYTLIGALQSVANSGPAHTAIAEWRADGQTTIDYSNAVATSKIAIGIEVVPGASNVAPTANAGADQTNIEPFSTVTLDFSGSADTDGTIASYNVSQTAGPTVTLSGSGSSRTFTAPATAAGTTLTFSLTVTDNGGSTSTADTVDITVLPWDNFQRVGGAWVPMRLVKVRSSNAWV